MTAPLAMYAAALRSAGAGHAPRLQVIGLDGTTLADVHPAQWTGGLRPGDEGLLTHCHGPTLDVGCGPGRLAAALTDRGRPALGVDVSPEAIRQARRRGVAALCRSVFERMPREGCWGHILLMDGNLGIGGDPTRAPVQAGLFASAVTCFVALPFVIGAGRRPDDPSALPLNYARGLILVLVLIWTVVALAAVRRRVVGRRAPLRPDPAS